MTRDDFSAAAMQGGYPYRDRPDGSSYIPEPFEATLLNSAAWKAVGKMEGWEERPHAYGMVDMSGWHAKMHGLIDALAEGESIEDYLATL
jgi:hypothetical protein